MNAFPEHIKVENACAFKKINNDRVLCILRKEVYELLLTRKDENSYVDLDTFSRKYCKNQPTILIKLVGQIVSELHELNWRTKLSFADTGLFIYSTDTPPTSCW